MAPEQEYSEALTLFSKTSVIAQQLLNDETNLLPKAWQQAPRKPTQIDQNRFNELLSKLQGWVSLKAAEMNEFEGEDLIRLHGEAVGCMYAIRELLHHFPTPQKNA